MTTSWACWACGYVSDAAARVGGDRYEPPDTGDASLCIGCGTIGIFDRSPVGALTVRRPTTPELTYAMSRREVVAALDAIQRTRGVTG
jgi:hypothetical protein